MLVEMNVKVQENPLQHLPQGVGVRINGCLRATAAGGPSSRLPATAPGTVFVASLLQEAVKAFDNFIGEHCQSERPNVVQYPIRILLQEQEVMGRGPRSTMLPEGSCRCPALRTRPHLIGVVQVLQKPRHPHHSPIEGLLRPNRHQQCNIGPGRKQAQRLLTIRGTILA